jgi:hypothetical protein
MAVLGWWRRRSQAAWFDLSVRWAFRLNFAFVPVLVATGHAPEFGPAVWLVRALIAVHGLLCVQLARRVRPPASHPEAQSHADEWMSVLARARSSATLFRVEITPGRVRQSGWPFRG